MADELQAQHKRRLKWIGRRRLADRLILLGVALLAFGLGVGVGAWLAN